MPTWEEIFTSSNPAGGRMINVISGVAGSEASPYTADNPSGGRAINVNLIGGGSVATGVLQLNGGAPLDTTLRSVTDQANTVSPLQLSTTSVNVTSIFYVDQDIQWNNNLGYGLKSANGTRVLSITNTLMSSSTTPLSLGTSTNSARLHVRGDGTNPIARFENIGGTNGWNINSTGLGLLPLVADTHSIGSSGFNLSAIWVGNISSGGAVSLNASTNNKIMVTNFNNYTSTSGTREVFSIEGLTFAAAAGSANFRPLNIAYTINNSGAQSGTATGIFLNATETALNGMTHNLMDLQVGGVSKVRVSNGGNIFLTAAAPYLQFNAASNSCFVQASTTELSFFSTSNKFLFSGAGSPLIQLGGATNAYPMLKRNGAAIEFRLADDSGYVPIYSSFVIASSSITTAGNFQCSGQTTSLFGYFGSATLGLRDNSAVLQTDSTTQGFLPPRMTTTQKNAISTPATGLVVFDTTLGKLCVYSGTWQTVTSV